ncbi:MAG: cytochrome c [Pyrinomonadaceae bacterium]
MPTVRCLKLFAIAFCIVTATIACSSGKSKRYVIAESKAYEASLFRQNCAICHGPEGEGKTLDDGRRIPNLREGEFKYKTDEQIYRHIADGGNGMTPFRGQLTDREITMMVRFVQDELRMPSPAQ